MAFTMNSPLTRKVKKVKAKGGGTDLENSIRFEVITEDDGFTVQFYMNNYGQFLDKGVSGTSNTQSEKD